MMNAVYELSPTEVKKRRTDSQGNISRELNNPSAELKDVAHKARNMGTTLWFTADELSEKGNMLNSLIACGQFTICFNLLEYIEKVVKGDTYKEAYDGYDDKLKADINDLYSRLMIDWKKFNDDPYWMVNEWNASELTK